MFSRLAVRRPISTIMVFAAAVILGLVSYKELSIQLLPDITLPGMVIGVRVQRSATEMLDTVTKPIEEIVQQLANVKEVRSYTRNGRGLWRIGESRDRGARRLALAFPMFDFPREKHARNQT